MVIRRSASSDTRQLVADLGADGPDAPLRREAAIARLRVIGARALRHLVPLLAPAIPAATRVAALRALEGCTDVTAVGPVLETLGDAEPDVRAAGLCVARTLLDGARGPDVLDRVTVLALDPGEPLPVRRAAITALADLPPRTLRPLVERLRTDPDAAVRALVEDRQIVAPSEPASALADAADGHLPGDPDYVLSLIAESGASAPLPTLHRLVGAIRAREGTEAHPAKKRDWLTVRGATHQALAARGSRVAAYDLREAIEMANRPLPDDFLRAASTIGDATVLEALAGAFVQATTPESVAWRAALADACRAIVTRERLTKRHAVVKRLHARWGDGVRQLLP